MKLYHILASTLFTLLLSATTTWSQIGKRFPSERKVVKDPVTGTMLTFLTSSQSGDSKIYPTHNQWTSDGQWLIFRSGKVAGEAMAVNEKTGDLVQVSEGGYSGMLNIARKSMKLYFMRTPGRDSATRRMRDSTQRQGGDTSQRPTPDTARRRIANSPVQIIEVDLAKLFADSKAGTLKAASVYQRVCGTTPASIGAGGDMALDGDEEWAFFRVGTEAAAKHLPAGTE
ncbi:MAG: hypothetical protein JWQ96_3398 [Segetibacter sp.]|nr:hypothetical protein [Segetibacter sp.]